MPAEAEWETLITYLGGDSVAGGKLKEAGTDHWAVPNTGATNETGFTALPGGWVSLYGGAFFSGYYSKWWSSTNNGTKNAWMRMMSYYNSGVLRWSDTIVYGSYVRCIKD